MSRIAVLLLLLLSACAHKPVLQHAPQQRIDNALSAPQIQLPIKSDWSFSGKIGYSANGKGGSAQIEWQQRSELSRVKLSAPIGLGAMRIEFTRTEARLYDAAGNLQQTGNPVVLFAQLLNMPVPVHSLVQGVRGDWPKQQFDALAPSAKWRENGWSWSYTQWFEVPIRLPRKIELSKDSARIRLVIERWQAE